MAKKKKKQTIADSDDDDECTITSWGGAGKLLLPGADVGVTYNLGAKTGCGKRQGEPAFAQTTCRGNWLGSEIPCSYCHDEHAIAKGIRYELRAPFTVNPIIKLPDTYKRNDKEDAVAILEGNRKNGSRTKQSSDKSTQFRAGDVIAKKYYSLECGACCTSRGLASPTRGQAAHSPSCLAHVPRVACPPHAPPPCLTHVPHDRGMPAARFAPCLAYVPRVACSPHAPPPCLTHVPRVACSPHAPPPARCMCHAWHSYAPLPNPNPKPYPHPHPLPTPYLPSTQPVYSRGHGEAWGHCRRGEESAEVLEVQGEPERQGYATAQDNKRVGGGRGGAQEGSRGQFDP